MKKNQNTSSAVMAQRTEPADSLDYFPTPPWAVRAFLFWLKGEGMMNRTDTAWEPACGEMHMVRGMLDYFEDVRASDIFDYNDRPRIAQTNLRHEIIDFTITGWTEPKRDWVFTNPPFRIAKQFIMTALKVAKKGVAMFVRTSFLESGDRHRDIFSHNPPDFVVIYAERVVLLKGRLIQAGKPDIFNLDEKTGLPRRASTATSYCVMVWLKGGDGDSRFRWIPESRLVYEADGDYPEYTQADVDAFHAE